MDELDQESDLSDLASRAQDGHANASEELDRRLRKLAHKKLTESGVRNHSDIEDICQDAVFEFFTTWDRGRSPAHFYFLTYCLRKHLSLHVAKDRKQAQMLSQRGVDSSAKEKPADSASLVPTDGPSYNELLYRLVHNRSPLINEPEKEVIRLRLDYPDLSARQVAQASGLNEGSVSILFNQKCPLELMRQWASGPDSEIDAALPQLVSKIDEWQREADYSLASKGMTLLLSGFTPMHSKRGIELVDARGEPYVLKLLIQRSQTALVEQELGFADELLNQVEHLLTSLDIPDRSLWIHRLYLARGRRHTAGFRYDNAIKCYNDLLKFVPESVWANDPVLLHSWAVACRGVRDYRNAKALMDRSLEIYDRHHRLTEVIHTISRRARVNIEEWEYSKNMNALEAAERDLYDLNDKLPRMREHPMAYAQILIHCIRLQGALGRSPEDFREMIEEANRLINLGCYAHEFLELEEVFEQYNFGRVFKDSFRIKYAPIRPRFGQKVMRSTRRRLQLARNR